jgi:hypothetical protein
MFTDFSVYSRQGKTIRPLSMVEINQGINRDPCAPKCETDSAGNEYCPTNQPTCVAVKNADGSWTEIRGEDQAEVDRAYDELTNSNVIETAPVNYDTTQYPTNSFTPPSTPSTPQKSEAELREERIRQNQLDAKAKADAAKQAQQDKIQAAKESGKSSGGGGGGGGGAPVDFSKTGDSQTPPEISAPSSSTGQGASTPSTPSTPSTSTKPPTQSGSYSNFAPSIPEPLTQNRDGSYTIKYKDGTTMTTFNPNEFMLQSNPAYAGQSGSNAPQYPAVGVTDGLINTSGSDAWVTDYNSIGFMNNDPIMGGTYSAPSGNNFSTTQGTNPATQVGVAYPLQQDIYDTYSNVTGAGMNASFGAPSFNSSTGQYVNATSNTIANPNTLPTTLTAWDLFGTAGASSGLFLDTPTIKQNGVAGTSEVDTATTAEPAQGGGLGLITIGLIALKALSVI